MAAQAVRPAARAFDRALRSHRALVDQARFYQIPRVRKPRTLTPAELSSIAELAFLKVFISWERFLEQVFTRYMCGANDARLRARCLIRTPSPEYALALIVPEGRPFVEWSDATRVRE